MTAETDKSTALDAFNRVDFEWVRQLKSVWQDPPYHIDAFHDDVAKTIVEDYKIKTRKLTDAPLGHVIVGGAGSGKTHLIGTLRRRVWEAGGWFVLLDFAGIKDFWASVALCFVTSLNHVMPSGETQYQAILTRLVGSDGFDPRIRTVLAKLIEQEDIAVRFDRETVRGFIQGFLVALDRAHPGALPYPDTVRACLLLILGDWDARNAAYSWLQGLELDPADLRGLGFGLARPAQIDLVRGMSWLMGLTGPTLIAVDQIDAIVSEANLRRGEGGASETNAATLSIIESLAGGLMELHDVKTRAITIVSCLEATWGILEEYVTVAMTDRFKMPKQLGSFKHAETARQMIEARLAQAYAEASFQPPYPTWPFVPEAFATAIRFSPRQLLKACDDHRVRCFAQGEVTELRTFEMKVVPPPPIGGKDELDPVFEEAKRKVDVAKFLESDADDTSLRDMLAKALDLYTLQTPVPDDVDLTLNADAGKQAPLHGRLTFTYHSENDRERHYCFRVLSHSHPTAFMSRLKAAMTASGIDRLLPFRHLFILRHDPPPTGPKTTKLVTEFEAAGGRFIRPSEDDLRTIVALRSLFATRREMFLPWLQARKPLCSTTLFQTAGLCEAERLDTAEESKSSLRGEMGLDRHHAAPTSKTGSFATRLAEMENDFKNAPELDLTPEQRKKWDDKVLSGVPGFAFGEDDAVASSAVPVPKLVIPVGQRIEAGGLKGIDGGIESIEVKYLPKHTAIVAGSGSGKTVLLRRIIEEAALLNIPAIVLDTNNDLVLLGEPWPARPEAFTDDDQAKADAYRSKVEVVVWTPWISSGRPLRLAVLPDFSALGDDLDERAQAVEMARATLLPYIRTNSRTERGNLKAGVLADALADFARRGGNSLDGLGAYLRDLPDGVSQIRDAPKLASGVSDQLFAAIAQDPLLAALGTPLDPQELFGDEHGGKTRISVINFSGLPSDESRQSFVNQLQMALFTFVKKHPSTRGRLYALDEAQNFAPAQKSTPCKDSTLSLVSQARKYGLGMIFATQAPKGIDNKIVLNCTTHFYGKMNSPVAIEAVKDLVAAKGGRADDIATLTTGVFYFSTEGASKPVKLRTPLCLSHHPQNPLDPTEVVARAKS
jgi:hypothetical protein